MRANDPRISTDAAERAQDYLARLMKEPNAAFQEWLQLRGRFAAICASRQISTIELDEATTSIAQLMADISWDARCEALPETAR